MAGLDYTPSVIILAVSYYVELKLLYLLPVALHHIHQG